MQPRSLKDISLLYKDGKWRDNKWGWIKKSLNDFWWFWIRNKRENLTLDHSPKCNFPSLKDLSLQKFKYGEKNWCKVLSSNKLDGNVLLRWGRCGKGHYPPQLGGSVGLPRENLNEGVSLKKEFLTSVFWVTTRERILTHKSGISLNYPLFVYDHVSLHHQQIVVK